MSYYGEKRYLNKKDIEFLEDLEIKLQKQSKKAKASNDYVTSEEFSTFWEILDKIECNHAKIIKTIVKSKREKRKLDKTYATPLYYKQYLKDRAEAKAKGVKFTKTVKDYKEEYRKLKEVD